MLKKVKGISRAGIIFRPVQWIWVQRWPLLIIIAPVVAGVTFSFIDAYLAPERAIHPTDKFLQEKQIAQVKKDVLQITSQILVGITVLSGAYFTWKRLEVSREDQITDRYTRAIDQLGSEHLEIRLGGIYALERLAKDSRKDQGTVMEVLTAFVRENASLKKSKKNSLSKSSDEESDEPIGKEEEKITEEVTPSTDIQAILTVIGRRKWEVTGRIDLSGADLSEADLGGASLGGADLRGASLHRADLREAFLYRAFLSGADLGGADLGGADLREAFLSGADLSEADLREAFLYRAFLSGADLREADLGGADLREASLHRADLSEAFLYRASLHRADLSEADLSEADLRGADLSGVKEITLDQVKAANYWERATYSDDMAAQLGLSSSPENSEGTSEEQPPPKN